VKRLGAIALMVLALVGCRREAEGLARVEWLTMSTTAAVARYGRGPIPIEALKAVSAAVERDLSRFDAESELRRLEGFSEMEILAKCKPENRPCYAAAFELARETGGAFNPRWRGAGTLDLGAIAKGFAVDLLAERTPLAGEGAVYDIGGNLKAQGAHVWTVGIDGSDRKFELRDGMACATSAETYRGKHIVDARTGLAVTNSLKSVTVIAPSAMWADALSTVCFILGEDDPAVARLLTRHSAQAIWVRKESK